MLPSQYTICTSSVEEFCSTISVNSNHMSSYISDPLANGQTTGRKTWKMTKSKKEAVWPQHLESALLKGLRKYKPASTKDPRHLLRFPRRNRFISEYIYETTGRVRTAKQVGSRLQQLRETCRDQRILDLILKKDFVVSRSSSPTPEAGSNSDTDSVHSPSPTLVSSYSTFSPHLSHRSLSSEGTASTLTSPVSAEFTPSPQPTVIPVQAALFEDEMFENPYQQAQTTGTPFFRIDLDECGMIDALPVHNPNPFVRRISMRRSQKIVPYAVFCSYRLSTDVAYRCITRIYRDSKLAFTDENHGIFLEAYTSNDINPQPISMHRARLVPDLSLWNTLIERPDSFHRYTVTQDIVPMLNAKTPGCTSFIIQYSFECGLTLANHDYLPAHEMHVPLSMAPTGIPADLEYSVSHVPVYDTTDPSTINYANPTEIIYNDPYLDGAHVQPSDMNLEDDSVYDLERSYHHPHSY